MNDTQKRLVVTISLVILGIFVMFLAWLNYALYFDSLVGNVWPGRGYLLLLDRSDGIKVFFKSLPFILAAGGAIIAASGAGKVGIYLGSTIAFLGLCLCFSLFLSLPDPDVARPLWALSKLESFSTYESIKNGNNLFLGPIAAWFIGYLIILLGISRDTGEGE